MVEETVFCGLGFMFVCAALALSHSLHVGRVTLLDWAVLGMGGIYGGGWALVSSVTLAGGNPYWEDRLLPLEHLYPLHTLSACILLATVILGWMLMGTLPALRHIRLEPPSRRSDGRLVLAAWVLLTAAVALQGLYAHAFGGFLELLDYSASIRSGTSVIENPVSFLQPFGGLALFSSFLFFGLWVAGCRRWNTGAGFLFAFVFSLYVLFSWRGRIGFLAYLATFPLGLLLFLRTRPLPLLAGGGLTMLLILVGAYQVSTLLDFKAAGSLATFLAGELSFPFVSFFAQLDSGEHLTRAFRDLLVAPVYLLPSSWWMNWVGDVSQVNTALVMGAPKGEAGVTGSIPVDLITLGMMQSAALGIAGAGVFFGAGLRAAQHLVDLVRSPGVRALFGSCVAIKIAVLAIYYAHPAHVVSANFALLVAVAVSAVIARAPGIRLGASPAFGRVVRSER